MLKLKLTPVFMLAVICIAAFLPLAFGVSVASLGASASVVCIATFLCEKGSGFSSVRNAQRGEVGEQLKKVENEYKQVTADLKIVGDQLKTHAEAVQKEIKAAGDLSKETKAKVDELLTVQGELKARLQSAEQILDQVSSRDNEPNRVLSLGQVVADSEQYKNFDRRAKSSFSVSINAAITSIDSSAGSLIEPTRVPGIITAPNRRLMIRDLIAPGRTTSDSVKFIRETGFTNSANVVSENPANPKPESDLAFEEDSADVATIAHWVRASRQVLDDAAMLASYIDARLRYGLQLKEEQQLLMGSGVGLNINGIYTQASNYANPGVTVANMTRIDQIRLALLQAELAEYYADGIVLNPIDWTAIELTKDGEGRYIMASPFAMTPATLWARPVVATKAIDAGDFLVGAFRMGAQLWDREDAVVTVSTEDRDNFVKNMVTILGEERLALTVYRPEAFVKGPFESSAS